MANFYNLLLVLFVNCVLRQIFYLLIQKLHFRIFVEQNWCRVCYKTIKIY